MIKSGLSRRSFLQVAATSAVAARFMTEPMLAAAARMPISHPALSKDAVMIDYNENPFSGPCEAARKAIADAIRKEAVIVTVTWMNC